MQAIKTSKNGFSSDETIHRKINEVCNIVPALTNRFVKLPRPDQTHSKITTDSRFIPFSQNCIGAIDGTHVPITIAEDNNLRIGIEKEPYLKMLC